MAGGRPKKTLDSVREVLPSNWKEVIIKEYKKGASDVETKAWLSEVLGSFSNDLWERWMEEEPEFSETIKKGRLFAEAWWTKIGRTNLKEKDFSATLFYMNMKNRFNWTDRVDQTTKGDKTAPVIVNLGEGEKE